MVLESKLPKVLFFINGSNPTEEEFKLASEMKAKVCFRNARVVRSDECAEKCDGVCGDFIPEPYRKYETFGEPKAKPKAKPKVENDTAFEVE